MRPSLRIAVLQCDISAKQAHLKLPPDSYTGPFLPLLHSAAEALNLVDTDALHITGYDVIYAQEYPALADVDALLLTGSKYDSFANDPWILKLVEYTKAAIQDHRVKLVGVCFGHQIIARALGAEVGRGEAGWEIAVCDVALTEQGRKVFGRDVLRIQQMHQDVVFDCPSHVMRLGSSPQCAVQGMYVSGKFVTIQGHPEFDEQVVTEIVRKRAQRGLSTEKESEGALERAGLAHDGVVVAVGILRFLLGEVD
ncbi:class I glutamine amidotransferase-like protein [Aspergillus avenaceus]|uniref:Class I glutamine amidotransferase-like protein n=1 Tax=Aspergillus avenaceus TaxID=36643 RepID=A0A5N6TKD0_ASPAV|nr:class I glutamine amidotransferase-like protein [Aspergillus avenaceus]